MTEKKEPKLQVSAVRAISHEKDLDGLSCASIVWRYAQRKGLVYNVTLTDYNAFEQVFPTFAGLRNTLLVVTDLGMDMSSLDTAIDSLSKAAAQGCRIVWLDHHLWPDKAVKAVLSLPNKPVLKIRHDLCAAEITCKVLMPDDPVSAEIAQLARDTDFNRREIEAAIALTDALSVLRFAAVDRREDTTSALKPLMLSLAEHGLSGVWDESKKQFKDDLLEKRVHNYRKEKVKKMRKALAGHQDLEVHQRLVRIVEIPAGVTTTDMGTFLSDTANLEVDGKKLPLADLLVTVSPGGMLGFRRGRDTVLCNEAAKFFDGGGHPYAAGGEYGMYTDFQAMSSDIFVTLSRSKDWVVNVSSEG